MNTLPPVHFENPPIVEVICGVTFSLSRPLSTAYVGTFWERVREEFPRTADAAPIPDMLDVDPAQPMPMIQLTDLPPLRRTWLFSDDGKHLLQIQEDRFILNWKDDAPTAYPRHYPRYANVYAKFETYLGKFRQFLVDKELGDLAPRQFELTYINHITPQNGLTNGAEHSILNDHIRNQRPDRFLPKPEGFAFRTMYPLPNEFGRLYVTAQIGRRAADSARVLRLDLAARGAPRDKSDTGRAQWFDVAHDWITRGFVDLTDENVQRTVWRKVS